MIHLVNTSVHGSLTQNMFFFISFFLINDALGAAFMMRIKGARFAETDSVYCDFGDDEKNTTKMVHNFLFWMEI